MSAANYPPPHLARGENARHSQQQTASENTRREHDDLLLAMHKLEAALASPSPTREEKWAGRAAQELADVTVFLETHILSAERPGGLFEELLLANPGAGKRVEALRREHSDLLEQARRLSGGLKPAHQSGSDVESLRREAANFLTALRHHHAHEVDLLFESFWTDLGVGD